MNTEERSRLLAEKTKLEGELSHIAIRSEQDPNYWETKPLDLDTDQADEGETAFALQQFEQNAAITKDLQARLNEVDATLARMNAGD